MGRYSIPPNIGKTFDSLKNSGYDLNSAIADIIDNSIDAKATEIEVNFSFEEKSIWVIDNGCGMNKDRMLEALKLGSDSEYCANTLGKFGFGLKSASLSQTNKIYLYSKIKNEENTLLFDLLQIKEKNEAFVTDSELPLNINTEMYTSGTIVYWSDLDFLLSSEDSAENLFYEKIGDLRRYIRLYFSIFIDEGLSIKFNGIKLKPIFPTPKVNTPLITIYNDDMIYFDNIIKIKYTSLPYLSNIENIIQLDQNEKEIYEENCLYVYRNKRLIQIIPLDDVLAVRKIKGNINIEIYFDETVDNLLEVNFQKHSIAIPKELKVKLTTLYKKVGNKGSIRRERKANRILGDNEIVPLWIDNIRKLPQLNIKNSEVKNFIDKYSVKIEDLDFLGNLLVEYYPSNETNQAKVNKEELVERRIRERINEFINLGLDHEVIVTILCSDQQYKDYKSIVIEVLEEYRDER